MNWHGKEVTPEFPTGRFLYDAITTNNDRAPTEPSGTTVKPEAQRAKEAIEKIVADARARDMALIEKIGPRNVCVKCIL